METVSQPTYNPTNKLTAAVIGVALVEVTRTALSNFAPGWSDPGMWSALSPVVVFACGWFVKDRPNA
jgi:hypothetical protein